MLTNHTISKRWLSLFSTSNSLPFFRIVVFHDGGASICCVCPFHRCFFHSPITVWRANLWCQLICLNWICQKMPDVNCLSEVFSTETKYQD